MRRSSGRSNRGPTGQPRDFPTGTVSFLFTDIEGSTQRWEKQTAAMSDALQRHDAILRSTVESHHGKIFKKIGDAVCAVFDRATDAATAAIEAQREFAKQDFSGIDGLRVRMAVHTGEAEERDGDYFGTTVNRVARLLGLGYGEQVLLSSVSAELLQRELPEQVLRELGAHHLKGLQEPERVFQLYARGLRTDFPPLQSPVETRNNLPLRLTSFVGRESEIAALKKRLENERLVSLVGPAGVGKTRLSLQLGSELLDEYPDGVWFVEFASVMKADFAASAIASAMEMRDLDDRSPIDSILNALQQKRALLILDNSEHLIDAVAKLAHAILSACPGIRIVATSREALSIAGESIHRVRTLEVPESAEGLTAQAALQFPAIALFVERAKAASDRFQLSDSEVPAVVEICRRLDGIPLAIELAAARVKSLSVSHICERLDERFRLLSGGSRSVLPRHQTMRAAIDWSYDLLEERARMLFSRLAIFVAGFSFDATRTVCSLEPLESSEVLDLLMELVEKSLVMAELGEGMDRYRLLDSTRQYGFEKLREGHEYEDISRKHAEYYCDLAEQIDVGSYTMPWAEWFEQPRQELENLRAALSWALIEKRDTALGGTLAGALERFWYEGGFVGEGQHWIERALESVEEARSPKVAARLWLARATLASGTERSAAAEHARRLYEALGDRRGLGYALVQSGVASYKTGQTARAEADLLRAVKLFEEASDAAGLARALTALGYVAMIRRDFDAARKAYTRSLDVAKMTKSDYPVMLTYMCLADLEFQSGNPERALKHADEALPLAQAEKGSSYLANLRCNLAAYHIALGQYDEASREAHEALRVLRGTLNGFLVTLALQHLALLAALGGDAERAARLAGYVDAYFSKNELTREPTEAWGRDRIAGSLRDQLSESAIVELARVGASLSEQQAIEEALKVPQGVAP